MKCTKEDVIEKMRERGYTWDSANEATSDVINSITDVLVDISGAVDEGAEKGTLEMRNFGSFTILPPKPRRYYDVGAGEVRERGFRNRFRMKLSKTITHQE